MKRSAHREEVKVLVTQSCSTRWLHGLLPDRLLCPCNSPGKSTGVGCHSLLQGIFATQGSNLGLLHCREILYHWATWEAPQARLKWKSLSHVWLFVTPWLHSPWNSPGQNTGEGRRSLLRGIFLTQRSNPSLLHCRQILLTAEPQVKPENIGVGSLSLLQGIFLIQELNWDLLHCRWALYQLSYQGSPQARLRVSSHCKEPSLQVQQGPKTSKHDSTETKRHGQYTCFWWNRNDSGEFHIICCVLRLRFCTPSTQGSRGSEFSWASLRGNIPLLCIRAMC